MRRDDHTLLCPLWRQLDRQHAEIQPDFFRRAVGLPRSEKSLVDAVGLPDRTILVAEIGGAVVGLVQLQVFETPDNPILVNSVRGHVSDLVVDPTHHRKGVGRALMERAAVWFAERAVTQVVLTVWQGNHGAEEFYRALGYRTVSRTMVADLNER